MRSYACAHPRGADIVSGYARKRGIPAKKKEPDSLRIKLLEKKSGIELLSHSQICSTIVAGPLIDRVRDGNVSCKPAMDTGKKRIKDARFMSVELSGRQANSKLGIAIL